MSQQSDYIAKLNAYLDRYDKGFEGVSGDISAANDLIKKLQNSQGTFTPEDQALADQLEARLGAAVAKIEKLDADNPPVAPPPTV